MCCCQFLPLLSLFVHLIFQRMVCLSRHYVSLPRVLLSFVFVSSFKPDDHSQISPVVVHVPAAYINTGVAAASNSFRLSFSG